MAGFEISGQHPSIFKPPAQYTSDQLAIIAREDDLRRQYATLHQFLGSNGDYPAIPSHNVFTEDIFVYQGGKKRFDGTPWSTFCGFVFSFILACTVTWKLDKQRNDSDVLNSVNREEFFRNWSRFTEGLLDGLDWSHVLAAGGAVLSCVTPQDSVKDRFQGSDVDLFIYGADEAEAQSKLIHIYETVSANMKSKKTEFEIIRTNKAVTILCPFPFRHIQVILRLFHAPWEILLGFDVDCCCVGFDGKDVWCTDRFVPAQNKSYNLVNTARRSVSYETRLRKYAKRGYAVAVPSLDKARVRPDLFDWKMKKERSGLEKLLLYEYYEVSGDKRRFSSYSRTLTRMLRMGRYRISNLKSEDAANFTDRLEEYAQSESNTPSHYCEVFIPWGPRWNVKTIMKALELRDKAQFFSSPNQLMKSSPGSHRHCLVSGIDGIIEGRADMYWCRLCKKKVPLSGMSESRYVSGPLSWDRNSPAFQDLDQGGFKRLERGCFHPVLDKPWDDGVYIPESAIPVDPTQHPLARPSQRAKPKISPKAGFSLAVGKSASNACSQCQRQFPSAQMLNLHVRNSHQAVGLGFGAVSAQTQDSTPLFLPLQPTQQPTGGAAGFFSSTAAPAVFNFEQASSEDSIIGDLDKLSPIAKILYLLQRCQKSGHLEEHEKGSLKDMIFQGRNLDSLTATGEAYQITRDMEDLADSLRHALKFQ